MGFFDLFSRQKQLAQSGAPEATAKPPFASPSSSAPPHVPAALVEQISRMDPETLFRHIHFEAETGLFSAYAWSELQKAEPRRWVLAVNVSHLVDSELSDAMGTAVTMEAARLLGICFQRLGGNEIWASHSHDDQFTAASNDRGLLEDVASGIAEVAGKVALFVRNGEVGVLQRGLDYRFATGATYTEADQASMPGRSRGTLTKVSSRAQFELALVTARDEGYLLLDGASLLAARKQAGAQVPAPGRVEWEDARAMLERAAGTARYFAVAADALACAAREAVGARRAKRIHEPTSVEKGSTTMSGPGGVTRLVSYATVYDVYEGSVSIGALPETKQDELLRAILGTAPEFRELVVQYDVKKAQAEGLWHLVVSLGLALEEDRVIKSFEHRGERDLLAIVRMLSGTLLGQRLEHAFSGGSLGAPPPYDWSELEESRDDELDGVIGQPASVVSGTIRSLLTPSRSSTSGGASSPPSRSTGIRGEGQYVDAIRKYELQRPDMQPLATIAAFAWKHGRMDPPQALEYAMVTIYLSRHGDPKARRDADTTWQSALAWSIDNGLQAFQWGVECIDRCRSARP